MTKLQRSAPVFLIAVAAVAGAAAGLWPLWQAGTRAAAAATVAAIARAEPITARRAQGWDFWTIEIDNLASELKEEKARLRKQSELIDQRAARLAADQDELAKLRAGVEQVRREIGERVIEIKADEAKNLRALSQTYGNLSPKAAVAIIKELDDTTVVKILSLMKPDVVAPIFEEMSAAAAADGALAKRAATLSEKLRLMKSAASGTSTAAR
jgi:flagellar motility protein MotE (MotC chaperone)